MDFQYGEWWRKDFRTGRARIEMATPADRFRLMPVAMDAALVSTESADDHAGQWVLRRVASNGVVSVDNQMFSVGNAYKGVIVDAFVDDTTIQVWRSSRTHSASVLSGLRGAQKEFRPTSP